MLGFHPIGGGALGEGPRDFDAVIEGVLSGTGGKKKRRSLADLYGPYRFLTPEQIKAREQQERELERQPEKPAPQPVFAVDAARLYRAEPIVTARLQAQISRLKAERDAKLAAMAQEQQDYDNIALLLLLAA